MARAKTIKLSKENNHARCQKRAAAESRRDEVDAGGNARRPQTLGVAALFPYAANLCVIAGIGYLTVYMDAVVIAGRLTTGMPYLLITALFAAIFAAYHFLNREG